MLDILESLVNSTARVAETVNDNKATQHQLEELQYHNRIMENRDIYLAPYKLGQYITHRKKNVDETLKMPRGVITDVQLRQLAELMRIPHILDISMRTTLHYRSKYIKTRAIP